MTTIRQSIQAEIDTETAKFNAKLAELQAKLAADEPTLAMLLDTEVEKVEAWFGRLASHFHAAAPAATPTP